MKGEGGINFTVGGFRAANRSDRPSMKKKRDVNERKGLNSSRKEKTERKGKYIYHDGRGRRTPLPNSFGR